MRKRSHGMNERSRSKIGSSEWITSIRPTRSATSASVYESQGKYAEAISWYERALKIYEREFGVDHINSASTINNIGIVYDSQGKYAEAISWYERALKIKEREFGVDHINSANTINNIGIRLLLAREVCRSDLMV